MNIVRCYSLHCDGILHDNDGTRQRCVLCTYPELLCHIGRTSLAASWDPEETLTRRNEWWCQK